VIDSRTRDRDPAPPAELVPPIDRPVRQALQSLLVRTETRQKSTSSFCLPNLPFLPRTPEGSLLKYATDRGPSNLLWLFKNFVFGFLRKSSPRHFTEKSSVCCSPLPEAGRSLIPGFAVRYISFMLPSVPKSKGQDQGPFLHMRWRAPRSI
jgi:hypothetical protein